jgi:hypothetical protein
MPNPEILSSPLVRKEAELFSKIEGTQSMMSEVLGYEAGENIKEKIGGLVVSNGKYSYNMRKRINSRLCYV